MKLTLHTFVGQYKHVRIEVCMHIRTQTKKHARIPTYTPTYTTIKHAHIWAERIHALISCFTGRLDLCLLYSTLGSGYQRLTTQADNYKLTYIHICTHIPYTRTLT